ncbi:hypothetical protein SDC9_182957 [bioreactor metagenome]|uniref:Uncharacterized protein n=1 Tax=bioreactor metagenome TaxID=1076179 RepID=A0A645HBF4_9ZZZZ
MGRGGSGCGRHLAVYGACACGGRGGASRQRRQGILNQILGPGRENDHNGGRCPHKGHDDPFIPFFFGPDLLDPFHHVLGELLRGLLLLYFLQPIVDGAKLCVKRPALVAAVKVLKHDFRLFCIGVAKGHVI